MRLIDLRFRPALFTSLRGYRPHDFGADLGAGLTVACVALPLAMAFGIASGVKPEQGLITAVVGGFLVSVFGGSRVQIGGPAGAFVALLYAIGERYGIANLLLSTMMAGVLLIAMGALRLGKMVHYVPVPIVIGFTSGIAVVIALSQLKDFLGLEIEHMPANFFSQLATLHAHLDTVNIPALGLGAAALALLFLWPKAGGGSAAHSKKGTEPDPSRGTPTMAAAAAAAAADAGINGNGSDPAPAPATPPVTPASAPAANPDRPAARRGAWARFVDTLRRVPGPLAVLVLATVLVWAFELPVETIGSRFGGIPQSLPPVSLPAFDWSTAQNLVTPTLSIAFLAAIESLLCARVADGMIGERHDPNQELMGQGIANCIAPLFGGIAVTGTIARTVTNVRSGARSPVAGMIHAVALLGFMLLLAPLAVHIPMSVLAAILLFVAYNMGEWHAFSRLRYFSNNYRLIMLATFLLTVIFDLTVAVEIGLLLACILFIVRVSSLTRLEPLTLPPSLAAATDGRRINAWRVFGSLFFGSTGKREALQAAGPLPDVVVLELHQVINLDTTGLDALRGLQKRLHQTGGRLILVAPNEQPLSLMRRSGFLQELGPTNLFSRLEDVWASLGGAQAAT